MVDCTPTWFEIREQVEHNTYLTADEVDRWLAEHDAKVRAETLRDAAAGLNAGMRGSKCNPACHEADQITLRMRSDRIEREAGLK